MIAQNEGNILVEGDDSAVYFADLGVVLPTLVTGDPGVDFTDVGCIGDDDGIETALEREATEVVHDGKVIRTKLKEGKTTFTFTGTETNPAVKALRHPAATFTTDPLTGVTRIDNMDKVVANEKAWVVDTGDGDRRTRTVHARGEVTEVKELVQKIGEPTSYTFTVTSYGAIYELTNNPAYVAS